MNVNNNHRVNSAIQSRNILDADPGRVAPSRPNHGAREPRRNSIAIMPRKVLLAVSALALLMVAAVSTASATSAASSPAQNVQVSLLSTLTMTAAADARVSQAAPSKNYGTSNYLAADATSHSEFRSYIRFSVSGLTGPVQSVTLRVYCTTNGTTNGPAVYLAGSNWTESGKGSITWKKQPALLSGAAANIGAIAVGSWATYDVTSLVTGNGTYTFALIPDSTDNAIFSSREGANAPQLVVTLPSPTSTPTSAASPTSTTIASATNAPTGTASPTNTPTSAATPTNTPTSVATSTNTPTPGASASIKHVFLVLMENHSYSEVWNTSSSPYITQLGNSYARATNYFATSHPSLPNYLDLYGGSNYGITTDCSPSSSCHVNAVSLADNLNAKGLTWKAYMESMPAPCYLTASGNYAPKHNPFIYFDDIRTDTIRCNSHDVPFTDFSSDLASAATTPNYVFITPDLCNDMHDCSVSTGDTWLANHLPAILSSPACTADKCLVVLTWDEDDNSAGNHVLTIFAGSAAKTGGVTSAVSYTHFSLLRTVESIFGLPTQTSNDAAASPMLDLLR